MFCLDDPILPDHENSYKTNLACAKLAALAAAGCAGIFVLCMGALWLLNLAIIRFAGARFVNLAELGDMVLDLGLIFFVVCLVPLLTIAAGYAVRAWRSRPGKGGPHAHC